MQLVPSYGSVGVFLFAPTAVCSYSFVIVVCHVNPWFGRVSSVGYVHDSFVVYTYVTVASDICLCGSGTVLYLYVCCNCDSVSLTLIFASASAGVSDKHSPVIKVQFTF